jgi:EmrB/QacA subfamily drug resistance transporter
MDPGVATLPRPTDEPPGPIGTVAPRPAADPPVEPPGPPAPESAQTVHTDRWPLALCVISIGMFMSVLDISIVNVAIPTMQNDFGVSTVDIEWVSTAYSLALGVIVPVSGWLGARVGLHRLYAWSVVGFGFASALCGFAWDLESEVAFRILQAIPGGILPVITLTMMYRVVPKDKMGVAMAVYGLSAVFAPATGPTLGGYFVEYHTWRWIFFMNIPVGIIGAVAAFMLLPKFPRADVGKFDKWGFVTIAGSLFTLLLALSKGSHWGWDGYRVLILLTASALLFATFVIVELEVEDPLLDVRLFKIWSFTNSLLGIGIVSSAFFTIIFYIPLFMQHGQGITPMNTGLAMLPEALSMIVALPIAGLLYTKVGPRYLIVTGMLITAFGTWLLVAISSDMSRADVMLWTSIRGFGQAFVAVPIMTAGMDNVPSAKLEGASALNSVMQRVAGALGLAAVTSYVTQNTAQVAADRGALTADMVSDPRIQAMGADGVQGYLAYYETWQLKVMAATYSNAFLVLTVFTLVAGAFALTFSGKKPAHTGSPMHMDIGM